MPIYEFTFGVYVEADDKDDAWERVRKISQALDKLDVEGQSAVEGPTVIPTTRERGDVNHAAG